MEELVFALLGLFALLVLVGIPILMISHVRLIRRVRGLEQQVQGMGRDPSVEPVSEAEVAAPAVAEPTAEPLNAGPWASAKAQPDRLALPTQTPDAAQPSEKPSRAFVFRGDRFAELGVWLRENWFLAVGAVSLALAGVFLVQYGVETGLLTPTMRVIGALALGAALIVVGDLLRRRYGDEDSGAMTFLPGALSGAGLVSLFAGVLAARVMYGLIGPGTALGGLVAVSILAVILGWFYGPLLAAVGILGATCAPFLVGGQSDTPELYFYYYALITLAGLAVDSVKRWAWISALVLIASFTATWLLFTSGAGEQHYLAFASLAVLGAVLIPERSLIPRHQGEAVFAGVLARLVRGFNTSVSVQFPTRLAAGTIVAAAVAGVLVAISNPAVGPVWMVLGFFGVLFIALVVGTQKAPALADMALVPALGVLVVIFHQSYEQGGLFVEFRDALKLGAEAGIPLTISWLTVAAAIGSILCFLRMKQEAGGWAVYWAILAAGLTPAVVVMFEMFWLPANVLGAYFWAGHVMAIAGLMTVLALRTARHGEDPQVKLRVALFALAALVMASLSLMLMLSDVALTLALAVMVVLAAGIDRRFDLRALALFIQLGTVVVSWRLVFEPGVDWAVGLVPLWEVVLVYAGSTVLLSGAWTLARRNQRLGNTVMLESAVWTLGGVFASVLLDRLLGVEGQDSHWGFGLLATVWTMSAVTQLYRLKLGGVWMRRMRMGLAALFGAVAVLMIGLMMTLGNPVLSTGELVVGPMVFNSLAVAYLPLMAVFAVASWKLTHLPPWVRHGAAALSAAFAAWYVALAIRHVWWGADLSGSAVMDGELYSYTIAMLAASAGLLWVAFSRRSVGLRKLAMVGVALTIAKVFLMDMSGLTGLIRVASFLGLGLALAALAWLNRKMTAQWERGQNEEA